MRTSLRSRSTTLVAVLLLTMGLAGVLAYEAWDAARSHRNTAERALRDYASFAAWEFGSSSKEHIYSSLLWIFSPIVHEEPLPHGVEPKPASVLLKYNDTKGAMCRPDSQRYAFRVDAPSRAVSFAGKLPAAPVQQWIRDTVIADLRSYKRDYAYHAILGKVGGKSIALVYQVKWRKDKTPAAAYGFELCLKRLAEPSFNKVLMKSMVLPPALTKGAPNDSLFSVVVTDGTGHLLYRSPRQYEPIYTGKSELASFGGVVTTVTVNPAIANSLVIGGLPHSRLPLLAGVLALSVALVAVGLLQLRRESELARLRADFIASVSHELRTPLAQVRMFAETLRLGRVRSEHERQRSLDIVDQEARRLTNLVENILQFSRSERESIRLSPNVCCIAPQIREGLDAFQPIAQARQVTIEATLDDSVRANVDSGALRQILLNLLDNAVKYGPAGAKVQVLLDRQNNMARIVVDDAGPGIPAAKRARVWTAFYRLDRDVESAVAGSGIGLAVVRELVERHGGRVAVAESPLGGARFVVEVPLSPDDRGDLTRNDASPTSATQPNDNSATPVGATTERL